MATRRILKRVARALIAMLLFAQGALALAACDWAQRSPALAIAQAGGGQGSANCMEQMRNANLCVAHCLGESQSLDKPSAALPAMPPAPMLTVQHFALEPRFSARVVDLPACSAGPPPRIVFQTFLL